MELWILANCSPNPGPIRSRPAARPALRHRYEGRRDRLSCLAAVINPYKSASVADCWSRCRWLKTDFVVDRISEPLLAAEVPFRCLNADVTEQELNLFKLPACLMTQTGAGTTKIVRRNPIQTALRGPGLHDAPDHL